MLTNPTLKFQIEALWLRFWSGGINNPLNAIEKMSYLIFLKRLEDTDNDAARRALRRREAHVSVYEAYIKTLVAAAEAKGDAIPELARKDPKGESLKWSHWKQLPGDEMLAFVRDTVFQFLRNLGAAYSAFTQYIQDATFIIQNPSSVTGSRQDYRRPVLERAVCRCAGRYLRVPPQPA